MTGAEHYGLAEEILSHLRSINLTDRDYDDAQKAIEYQRAQVHATLALTQATLVGMEREDWARS